MLSSIPIIYLAVLAISIGFTGLIWSADKFVYGAASIAKNLGMSSMLVGLTVVSFGTSAPEVLVSLNASLSHSGELAVGNALGSNIANIALVLAVTALVARIPIQKHILTDELPILMTLTILSGFILYDAKITRIEGYLLALLLIPTMLFLVMRKRKSVSCDPDEEQKIAHKTQPITHKTQHTVKTSIRHATFWFLIGLVLLIGSSKLLVWGATLSAEYFGVSSLVIGLTVLAVGTSLPELAASIMSALKGHHDIALGNIIGSNIFNMLAVMSIPGIIYPTIMKANVFTRDFIAMLSITCLLAVIITLAFVRRNDDHSIGRMSGAILLTSYIAYYIVLFTAH